MPLYDYECRACGVVHEIKHGFNDSVDYPCPSCGTGTLSRKFHAAPIVFKGSGYYVTDSRGSNAGSKPKPGEAGAESTSGDTPAGTKSGGDDAKKPAKPDVAKSETAPSSKPEAAA